MTNQLSVVVTGVSSGIGLGITEVLMSHGVRIFGSVRKPNDADRLCERFGKSFVPLLFDVTDAPAIVTASRLVRDELAGMPLLGLVNNAGLGTAGPLLDLPLSELRRQLEVNLVAPLSVVQNFASLLQRSDISPAGRIVNIGSTAGRIGMPFFGAYSASKHGLEGLSEALRRELMLYGIDVITVVPGPVKTAIWDKAAALDLSAYAATAYGPLVEAFRDHMVKEGRGGLEPQKIGQAVWGALTSARPKDHYVVTKGRLQNWTIPTQLPKRLVDKLIGRKLGLTRTDASTTRAHAEGDPALP